MAVRPIAYSIFSIILAAKQETLRGIERIDLGYISNIFEEWPADCYGVFPTVLGLRLFPRDQVLAGRDLLVKMWRETEQDSVDSSFEWLKAAYANQIQRQAAISPDRKSSDLRGYWRVARMMLRDGLQFGLPLTSLPENAIYIDVGHNGLATPIMYRWLTRRPDVKPVFMLHDAIPLELPELVSKRNVAIHHKILATTAAHARAVIVPTKSAGRSVHAELSHLGAGEIPIHAINLPIEDAFRRTYTPEPAFAGRPYFLVCGAFEARKNPTMLLNVWRALVTKLGDAAPRLIFAGRPGHASAEAVDQIRRSKLLRDHVFLASGLSTAAMARLMIGARALLMPSFAEGFGLPPVESLTLGTPAVLSDIPAHRDAVGDYGLFIDPTDGPGWQSQIEKLMRDGHEYAAAKQRIKAFTPKSWPDYMGEVDAVLRGL